MTNGQSPDGLPRVNGALPPSGGAAGARDATHIRIRIRGRGSFIFLGGALFIFPQRKRRMESFSPSLGRRRPAASDPPPLPRPNSLGAAVDLGAPVSYDEWLAARNS